MKKSGFYALIKYVYDFLQLLTLSLHSHHIRLTFEQTRSEAATQLLQREKRSFEEKNKELISRNRRLEGDLSTEETHREQARYKIYSLKYCHSYHQNSL